MTDEKPWYLSRTVWASIATVVLALAGMLGLPAQAGDAAELSEVLSQLAAAICGLIAILGRLRARSRLH